jgi:uncharacterized protein YjlB
MTGSQPETCFFARDERTPNSPLPLLVYRNVVPVGVAADVAHRFETMFAANGWGDGWRNGIHPFLHFHTGTHEVLGIAAGHAVVRFGGDAGRALELKAGDVAVLPAGVGHQRLQASRDLLVVGAYPRNGRFDQKRPDEVNGETARRAVAQVALPDRDPVHGADGPLRKLWR